ncbi:MAG: hypothetical protein J7498_04800 [Sphingobium sp.]|nr:hypothetical protein [Sphingobium sp.]
MAPKVRRILMWGGMFVLASVGGSVLGSFAISGLGSGDKSLPDSSDVKNFWAAQDRAHANSAYEAAPEAIYVGSKGNHVCEGCDAGETRGRLRLQNLAGSYSEQAGGDAVPPAEVEEPPPPAIGAVAR